MSYTEGRESEMNVILFESMPEGGFVPASDERFVHVRDILAL